MYRISNQTLLHIAPVFCARLGACLCFALIALSNVASHVSAQSMTASEVDANLEKVSFDAVQPILRKHCERCHNEDQPRGDLVLTSLDKVLAGSSSGNVVVAGKLEESPLYLLSAHVDTPKMPPNKPRIPQRELNVLERWILTGLAEETQAPPSKAPLAEPAMKPSPSVKKPFGEKKADSVVEASGVPIVFEALGAIPQPTAVRAMAAHPSEPIVAVSGLHQVAIFNIDSATFDTQAIDVGERDVSALRFSPDGKHLLIAAGMIGESGTVLVLDWLKKQWLPSVGDEPDNIQSLDCNGDASQIAIGTTTRLVKILDRSTKKELFVQRKHTDWVLSVAYSSDGFLLASGDRFGGIHVWETDSGKAFASLRGHTGGITGLVWSRDGNELTSSSLDGTIRIWNMHTLQVERQWLANERGVLGLAMDSNHSLITSDRDGWVRKWNADGLTSSWQSQLPDEAVFVCSSAATPGAFVTADAAGGIYRFGNSVAGTNESVDRVLVSFPSSQQRRMFTASAPIALKRSSVRPTMSRDDTNHVLDLKSANPSELSSVAQSSHATDLASSTWLSDLEESRRALASVAQSLEQTYRTAEQLEESLARLKQLIALQEARWKQSELKQKPNRKQ